MQPPLWLWCAGLLALLAALAGQSACQNSDQDFWNTVIRSSDLNAQKESLIELAPDYFKQKSIVLKTRKPISEATRKTKTLNFIGSLLQNNLTEGDDVHGRNFAATTNQPVVLISTGGSSKTSGSSNLSAFINEPSRGSNSLTADSPAVVAATPLTDVIFTTIDKGLNRVIVGRNPINHQQYDEAKDPDWPEDHGSVSLIQHRVQYYGMRTFAPTRLPKNYQERVKNYDYTETNSLPSGEICYYCGVAASNYVNMATLIKSRLPNIKYHSQESLDPVKGNHSSTSFVRICKDLGFDNLRIVFHDYGKELHNVLDKELQPNEPIKDFVLANIVNGTYRYNKIIRAWKSGCSNLGVHEHNQKQQTNSVGSCNKLEYFVIDHETNNMTQRFQFPDEAISNNSMYKLIDLDQIHTESHESSYNVVRKRRSTSNFMRSKRSLLTRNNLSSRENRVGLPREYLARLEELDFREVNDVEGTSNCYFCILAALRNMTVKEFLQSNNIVQADYLQHVPTIDQMVATLQSHGYPETRLLFSGVHFRMFKYLRHQLEPGTSTTILVGYQFPQKSATSHPDDDGVHMVLVRAWKDDKGAFKRMVTDFEFDLDHPERFRLEITPGSVQYVDDQTKYFAVRPLIVDGWNEARLHDEIVSLDHSDELYMQPKCGNRMVGYLASWSPKPLTIQQAAYMTNLVFAYAQLDEQGHVSLPKETVVKRRYLEALLARKALSLRNISLPLSISIRPKRSEIYSSVMASEILRSEFIRNLMTFMETYSFDGVDIDWEYPSAKGNLNDGYNYVSFLRELRAAMVGSSKLISVAVPADPNHLAGMDIKQTSDLVDWIAVMSYDYYGAWNSKWGAQVGPNAPLHYGSPPGHSGKLNVNYTMKWYVCQTRQPKKIVMGVPFYGRYWSNTKGGVYSDEYPLFRTASKTSDGKYGGDQSYRNLVRGWLRLSSSFQFHWDHRTETPWAMQEGTNLTLSYDSPKSVLQKAVYASAHNLGGLMFWSLEQDDQQLSLTRAASSGVCQYELNPSNSIRYTCNPINETRWWTWSENSTNAGLCGPTSPLYKGFYPRCDPDDPSLSCCNEVGQCGSGSDYCNCANCVNYHLQPDKLNAEPTKPTRDVQWHFNHHDLVKAEPRCGPKAPLLNGQQAICNPDNDFGYCCSPSGHCGAGDAYCTCKGCKDHRKTNNNRTQVVSTRPKGVRRFN